jgi:hypothetical protein
VADLRAYFLKLDHWHQRLVPETDDELDKATETLRTRLVLSTVIAHQALKTVLTPYFHSGWCLAAIEHALRWRPNGHHQPMFADPDETGDERKRTRGWLVERQLAKWCKDGVPLPPPRDAQTTEDAFRLARRALEHASHQRRPDAASHNRRREVVDAARTAETERVSRRRRDRVAAAREGERRTRAAMGDLNRLAGLHDSDNVEEIPSPQWRNEADRRHRQSEMVGAARSGFLDLVEDVQVRAHTEGAAAVYTPEMNKVISRKRRDARTESSLAYLDQLIEENTRAG